MKCSLGSGSSGQDYKPTLFIEGPAAQLQAARIAIMKNLIARIKHAVLAVPEPVLQLYKNAVVSESVCRAFEAANVKCVCEPLDGPAAKHLDAADGKSANIRLVAPDQDQLYRANGKIHYDLPSFRNANTRTYP